MSEYQAQIDGERTIDELRRRVTDLENIIAQWQVNGAEDMFSVAGGQIYGGGVMRIDNEGLQILTEGAERPALWFFDDRFSNNPSSKYPQSRIQGTVIDGTSSSMGISSLFGLGASDERATWVVQASSTGNGRARSYPAQGFLGLGDGWEDVQISSGVVALNQGYSLLAIDPETGSSDSLEEITGPHGAGDLLVIRASGSGDSITVVNGANKIETSDGNNVTISGQTQAMGFISLGTGGWREIFRPAGSGGGMQLLAIKPSDTTRTSTTTTSADPHLTSAIGANENWVYEFYFVVNSAATPDFKFQISAPAGAAGMVTYSNSQDSSSVTNNHYANLSTDDPLIAASWPQIVALRASVDNGANAGNVALHWSQNTSDAGNTIVLAGGYMLGMRG